MDIIDSIHNYTIIRPILFTCISWCEICKQLEPTNGRFFNYVLAINNRSIYVGQSRRLHDRLYTHKFKKNFNDVYLLEFETLENSTQNEKALIYGLQPKLNINGIN